MEINYHICFRNDEAPELINYLKENGIPVNEGKLLTTVDILESHYQWDNVSQFLVNNKVSTYAETSFTKDELLKAEWIRVRSQWRCGYPQPENTFMTDPATYSRDNYCPKCGSGEVQIAPFRMKKAPKWGKRHFAELNWIGDELFLSGTAKTILENANISGISFREVTSKNGKEVLDDVFQLVVPFILPNGIVEEFTNFKEITVCSACGQKKYVPSGIGMQAYRKETFFKAPDVVKTAEIFGSMRYAVRNIIIHNNVYQEIIANNLDRGLVFEPIDLV